jgi:hypothetical protein
MDILPAIPDDDAFKAALVAAGVPWEFARHALAITDKRHPEYSQVSNRWPRSNPKGFAEWFEGRMRTVAVPRMERLVSEARYASVEQVPSYEWKTPLQRSIQLLKRHRDVMFRDNADSKPISMVITTLSARAYDGEHDLHEALCALVRQMPGLVRKSRPRVPNPVDPAEDFADKWASNRHLEESFWAWHAQVSADIEILGDYLETVELRGLTLKKLALDLGADGFPGAGVQPETATEITPRAVPTVKITAPPKPWGSHA